MYVIMTKLMFEYRVVSDSGQPSFFCSCRPFVENRVVSDSGQADSELPQEGVRLRTV